MLDRWSGKKNVDLNLTTWEAIFEEKLKTDIVAGKGWAFLLTKGCNPSALKLCLFKILVDLDNLYWRNWWESAERAASYHKALRMRKDAEVLSWMSHDHSDLGYADYFLDHTSKTLLKAAAAADLEGADRSCVNPYQNCFLMVLVSYVRRITKGKHFVHMAALVRCGCIPDDGKGGYTGDAVRQAFNRFRREHPSAWESIDQAVGTWCKNPHFPNGLFEPNSTPF